jgi:hypothetical protein
VFDCITGPERRDAGRRMPELLRFVRLRPARPCSDPPRRAGGRGNWTLLNDLLDVLRQLRDQGQTVLLVEHDMKVVMGRIVERYCGP